MSFQPQLVIDRDTRELCLQIRFGQYVATKALPDGFGTWGDKSQQLYIELHTQEMIDGLLERRREDQRKIKRKAEEC